MLHEHEMVRRGLARWHNGRLIPIMKGGDGRDEPLFPQLADVPEDLATWDLSGLDDAELTALAAGIRERVTEVIAGRRDPEVVGALTQRQVGDEVERAVNVALRVDEELETRADLEGEYDSTLEQQGARLGLSQSDQGDGDGDGDGDGSDGDGEGDGDGDGATTAAAATQSTSRTSAARAPLPAARTHRPAASVEVIETALRTTAHSASLGSPMPSMSILDRDSLGEFLTDIIRRQRVQPGQKTVLAHASFQYPRERRLEDGPDGHETNSRRIQAALRSAGLTFEALTASGGLCAPLPPIYDLPGIETAARPVRDALPSFQAARGGVQVGTTPRMGDYAGAAGVVTAEENAAGGTSAVKNCLRISCPQFASVLADSIYQCVEADNLAAMAYPELMSRIYDLVNAEQARLADSKLLQAIKDDSTQVTYGAADVGATYYFNGAIYAGAAGIRSRNRTTSGLALQALIPAWVLDLLALDQSRQANQDMRPQTRAAVETYLAGLGIVPYFYLDGPGDGDGMIFPAQTPDAALEDFPTTAEIALYPAGTWLHLDSGELNLGVVRDSALNSTNDFQTFQETWENVAKVGVESLWLTITLCPSGIAPSSGTPTIDCLGG